MKVRRRPAPEYDARQAVTAGTYTTEAGVMRWNAGDWLLYDEEELVDVLTPEVFFTQYEPLDAR